MAIELVRCLARDPDILVVAISTEERREGLRDRLAGLRQVRAGRGLIVCLPGAGALDEAAPFDAVIAVENSAVVAAEPVRAEAEPVAVA
jgi:hypothetical protein